jgi:DNA polymerase III delta subunit
MAVGFPFITLLAGDDSIGRDRARDDFVASLVKEHGAPGEEHYDSAQETFEQYLERVITPSLFASFRIFYVNHCQSLSGAELAQISALKGYDIPDVCLILMADECKGGAGKSELSKEYEKWLKAFERLAADEPERFSSKQFPKPRDYEIAGWLVSHVPSLFKRRMTAADAEYFVDLVGSDFDRIHTELQKLDIYLAEGQPVDRAAITEVVESTRSMTGFELAQALGRKDLARALAVVDSLFTGQFYAPPVVSAVFQHFWTLLKIRAFQRVSPATVQSYLQAARSRNRDATNKAALEIAMAAGVLTDKQANRLFPAIIKPAIIEQSQTFTEANLRAIVRWLRDYDVGIKTGAVTDTKANIQVLCYKIVKPTETVDALG